MGPYTPLIFSPFVPGSPLEFIYNSFIIHLNIHYYPYPWSQVQVMVGTGTGQL